jgi:hypothetical protein
MGPVEWQDKEAQVKPLIQAVAANYKNPKKALTDLATAMFAIASVSKSTPPGIENLQGKQAAPFGDYQPTGNEPPAVKTGQTGSVNKANPAADQLPPSRPAASRTDYDWVAGGGVGPNTRLSDVGAVGGQNSGGRRDNIDPRMRKIYKDNPELLKRANAGDPEAKKQIAALLKSTAAPARRQP